MFFAFFLGVADDPAGSRVVFTMPSKYVIPIVA